MIGDKDAAPNATDSYGSAPVGNFQAIHRPDATATMAAYIRYHADHLARCLVEGKPASDIAHYADHLAELIMRARAQGIAT